MIELEKGGMHEGICDCCGNTTISLTRFVYKDGDAYAVYYAKYTNGHPELAVTAIASIGEWGEDDPDLSKRHSFAFDIWQDESTFNITVRNAYDSPWGDVEQLGVKLSREEALVHPRINELFAISDEIVVEDSEVIAHFE